jgi:hypothetical protein
VPAASPLVRGALLTVARIIVLDSGPLGLAARRPSIIEVQHCLAWLARLETSGAMIVVPEIADYEVRRELIRARIASGVGRLDRLKTRLFYLPISTSACSRPLCSGRLYDSKVCPRQAPTLSTPIASSRAWLPQPSARAIRLRSPPTTRSTWHDSRESTRGIGFPSTDSGDSSLSEHQ